MIGTSPSLDRIISDSRTLTTAEVAAKLAQGCDPDRLHDDEHAFDVLHGAGVRPWEVDVHRWDEIRDAAAALLSAGRTETLKGLAALIVSCVAAWLFSGPAHAADGPLLSSETGAWLLFGLGLFAFVMALLPPPRRAAPESDRDLEG